MQRLRAAVLAATICVASVSHATAQDAPPPPPKALTGSAGAGLSVTSGNSDTQNLSATTDSVYDPKNGHVMKWNALYLRGKQNGVLAVNRVSAMFRNENSLSGKLFVFGAVDVLHDTFKGIDYLYAPAAGLGYNALNTDRSHFTVDVGVGGVIEKDTGFESRASGAITLGEKLVQQLTETTTLKESITALLKMNQFSDSLYTFQVGVAARVSQRLQLSIDVLDTYKSQPQDPLTKKNDLALVTSIIAKY